MRATETPVAFVHGWICPNVAERAVQGYLTRVQPGHTMSLLHRLRQRRRYASTLLAAFALAWLQMAIAPCLMAGELSQSHLSADAGSAQFDLLDPHGGHGGPAAVPGGESSPHSHCDYCPPQAADPGCADATADCAYPHEPGLDGRSALQSQLEKLSTHAALLDGSAFGLLRVLREPVVIDLPDPKPSPARRSLILENCVQLR
jgi:hypothetical protein